MKVIINKKKIGVWLPCKMFQTLESEIKSHNDAGNTPKLNLSKAAYILNLFYFIPLNSEEKYEDGWIPICSETLNNIKVYKMYINFLQEKDFLDKRCLEYSTSTKKCKKYKLGKVYSNKVIDFHWIEDNSHFNKKSNEYKLDRMKLADNKCVHLTKWLNPNSLKIDSISALKYTINEYDKKSQIKKKNKRLYLIKSIQNRYWFYSREGLDNRLHSIFTSLPKDLRKFIKYNDEELISIDIKSSQPFIYTSILNQIINPTINRLNNHLTYEHIELHTSIMSDLFRNYLNYNEIQDFINQVLDGTFYEHFGDILYNEGMISLDINGNCYLINPIKIKGTWIRNLVKFDTLRDTAKHVVMQTLFSSVHHHSEFINIFKNRYPEIYRITQYIKADKEKNYFPVLLQNIEANCVLDYCTRMISEKYPDMPIFTIHDSIVTTTKYKNTLEKEFKVLLGKYFGLTPKLKTEEWSKDYPLAS